jgi:osmotically-inducible protein OsmY
MTKHNLHHDKTNAVLATALLAGLSLTSTLQAESRLPEAGKRIPGTDIALEARLSTAYALNEYLNPFDLRVDVEKGRVTLRGSVPSDVQRWLAERLAHNFGPAAGVDNQLKVEPVIGDATPSELYRLVEDTNTTTRVQLRLLWNQTTGDQPIRVSTSDGRVQLTGSASSEKARASAETLAAMTTGVRAVENALEVKPETEASASATQAHLTLDRTDAGIAQRLRNSLHFDTRVPARDIDAEVRDGAAILKGQVESEAQRAQAGTIASRLIGVNSVDNRLLVEPQREQQG